jgi:hypothetical protein
MRSLARCYAGCSALFLDEHGRVFTPGPSPESLPKRDAVVKVLETSSFTGHEKRKSRMSLSILFHPHHEWTERTSKRVL